LRSCAIATLAAQLRRLKFQRRDLACIQTVGGQKRKVGQLLTVFRGYILTVKCTEEDKGKFNLILQFLIKVLKESLPRGRLHVSDLRTNCHRIPFKICIQRVSGFNYPQLQLLVNTNQEKSIAI
jgi:hypothetical protein